MPNLFFDAFIVVVGRLRVSLRLPRENTITVCTQHYLLLDSLIIAMSQRSPYFHLNRTPKDLQLCCFSNEAKKSSLNCGNISLSSIKADSYDIRGIGKKVLRKGKNVSSTKEFNYGSEYFRWNIANIGRYFQ